MNFQLKAVLSIVSATFVFTNYSFASESSESPLTGSMPKTVQTGSKSGDSLPANNSNSKKSNFISHTPVDHDEIWRHTSKAATEKLLNDPKRLDKHLETSYGFYKSPKNQKNDDKDGEGKNNSKLTIGTKYKF